MESHASRSQDVGSWVSDSPLGSVQLSMAVFERVCVPRARNRCNDLTGPGGMLASYRYVRPMLTYHVPLYVVHVCATAHLPRCVGVAWGPSSELGPRVENVQFSGLQDMSPREGGTTYRGRLVCRLKTAVFYPRYTKRSVICNVLG